MHSHPRLSFPTPDPTIVPPRMDFLLASPGRTVFRRLSRSVPAVVSIASLVLATAIGNRTDAADDAAAAAVTFQSGDHVCFVGNALGERLQHHNRFEAMVHAAVPGRELSIRNLCFPGDEVYERIRSENFGSPDDHLRHSGANVVVYFFGYNESFDGLDAADTFEQRLKRLAKETAATDYGNGNARVVFVSPIAFEDTGDRNLPSGEEINQRLAKYTAAMRRAAEQSGAAFVDVFEPSRAMFAASDERLTLNGCHLNDAGYEAFAAVLFQAMFSAEAPPVTELLVDAVDDKNFHWWHRYRAVNGFSIYGGRGKAGSDGTYNNRDVMERERAILDEMTANRDQRIWQLAAGKDVPPTIDDSNTLPFIEPKTNVGGPDDEQAKRGKLGSLEYLTSEEQLELFEVHEGFEIQLVASEEDFPELANPVALGFDNAGQLYVATMPSYPHWKPKTEMDDKILMFPDENGDGVADRCVVYCDGLHQPTGFEFSDEGLYIAEQPDILYVKDTDGDGVTDHRVRKLFGFDSADSHHGIAAFEWGPGGHLYFQEGTFKYSQVETPYGLRRLGEGGVWAYHPHLESVDVFVNFAFANPWGHVFNDWGQSFVADASPGNSYWSSPISGHLEYPLKHPGGSQHRRVAKLGGGDPQYRRPTFYPKRTRPSAGAALVSGDHFPPDMQGNFLLTNVIGDRSVLSHRVVESGSGYAGTEVDPIVSCRDGNFRPVDVEFAPDGSLYIVDWHNALIGHLQHNLRDPSRDHSHGRIWRVKHKTRPLMQPPQVAGAEIEDLIAMLESSDDRLKYRARRELLFRDAATVIAAANRWSADAGDDPAGVRKRLETLWLHQAHNVLNETLLNTVLDSSDHRARAAAVRVLSHWIRQVSDPMKALEVAVLDDHPRVRLEAVRALSFAEGDEAMRLALRVLEKETDDDLNYTLEETLRGLEQKKSQTETQPAEADPAIASAGR